MRTIGSGLDMSVVQAAAAQPAVAKARERARVLTTGPRQFRDLVELRLAEVDTPQAVLTAGDEGRQQEQTSEERQRQREGCDRQEPDALPLRFPPVELRPAVDLRV